MMKIIMVAIAVITSIESSLFAQETRDKRIEDFFISVGELPKGSKYSYYAYELLKSDTLEHSDSCGIYRIGLYASHSYAHLLLLDKHQETFLDCHTDLYKILSSVLSFLDNCSCRFTDSEKLSYVKEVMDIYHRNKSAIPW